MKKQILIFISTLFFLLASVAVAQEQESESGYYMVRKGKKHQSVLYMKIKDTISWIKKGVVVEETIGGIKTLRTLVEREKVEYKVYMPVEVTGNWKFGEVKHDDDEPDKLFLNPYVFLKKRIYNNKSYIKIPENSYVKLLRRYWNWKAITIPFAIRPSLKRGNKEIGSKITTDLKLGASIAYNFNSIKFKNKRLKAKNSVLGFSLGLGFGFSKVALDESSTSLLDVPYQNDEDGLAFFIAPGVGINFKGFQVNLFYGADIGLTSNVNDWNYNNKGFLGIGIGVNTSTLFGG